MDIYNLGRIGEEVAANYLVAQGFDILDANFYNKRGYRMGEIDIVAKDKKGEIIFVEVKSRKTAVCDKVVPEENLTNSKIRRIQKAATHYLTKNGLLGQNWRIDLITVIFNTASRKMSIRHIKAARI